MRFFYGIVNKSWSLTGARHEDWRTRRFSLTRWNNPSPGIPRYETDVISRNSQTAQDSPGFRCETDLPSRRISADWKCEISRARNASGRAGARRGIRVALALGKRGWVIGGPHKPRLRNANFQCIFVIYCTRMSPPLHGHHCMQNSRFCCGWVYYWDWIYVECAKHFLNMCEGKNLARMTIACAARFMP